MRRYPIENPPIPFVHFIVIGAALVVMAIALEYWLHKVKRKHIVMDEPQDAPISSLDMHQRANTQYGCGSYANTSDKVYDYNADI